MVPPSVPAAATFLQVALKPLLTTLESLRNLTVSLFPLLVTFGGASLPHFLNSSEPSVSRTGRSREESDHDVTIIIILIPDTKSYPQVLSFSMSKSTKVSSILAPSSTCMVRN